MFLLTKCYWSQLKYRNIEFSVIGILLNSALWYSVCSLCKSSTPQKLFFVVVVVLKADQQFVGKVSSVVPVMSLRPNKAAHETTFMLLFM